MLRIAFVERIGHRGGSKVDIRSDDTFFQNLYLQLEVEEIYDVLTRLIQRKAGVAPKRWVIFDESKYDVRNPKTAFTVEAFLQSIRKKKLKISYSKIPKAIDLHNNIFKDRLKHLLRIMFMVNDFDPINQRLSVKFMDFYSQYNTEISIYLIYMAFAMNYCDDVKAD